MGRRIEFRRTRTGAVLFAAAMLCSAGLPLSAQAQSSADLQARVQRLERDLRDLQAETFRRGGNRPAASAQAAPEPLPAPVVEAPPPQPTVDLNPLMRRIDEIQESIGRLTGQMEELGHQIDQLSQRADRMQKQMDFQAMQGNSAPLAEGRAPNDTLASAAPPDANAPILPPLPPAPGTLGQIPADTPLPTVRTGQPPAAAAPPPDPKREFDSAMGLLSRAQYQQASLAFRSFADAHPDDDRASAALYWTGDIAFSTKKDYDEAARDFAELLKKYPKAARAPDSMLKLGLSLFELGQMKEGCAALAALPAKYPDASPAIATRARNERRDNKCR